MSESEQHTAAHLIDRISKIPTPPVPKKDDNAQACSQSQVEAENIIPRHPVNSSPRPPSDENYLPESPRKSGEEQNAHHGSSSSQIEATNYWPFMLSSLRSRSIVKSTPNLLPTANERCKIRPGLCIPQPPRPVLQTRGLFAGRKLTPPLNINLELMYNPDGTFYRGAAVYYKVIVPNLPNIENYQSHHMLEKKKLLCLYMGRLGIILEHKYCNTEKQAEKKMLDHLDKIFSMSGECDKYETSARKEEAKIDFVLTWLELIIRFQDPDSDLGPNARTRTASEGPETPAQKIQRKGAEAQRTIEIEIKARAEAGTLPFWKSVRGGMKKWLREAGYNVQD